MINTGILRYLAPVLALSVVAFQVLQTRIEHSTGVEAGQAARIGFRLQFAVFAAVLVLVAAMLWPRKGSEEERWIRVLRRSVITVLITLAALTCLSLLVSFQY